PRSCEREPGRSGAPSSRSLTESRMEAPGEAATTYMTLLCLSVVLLLFHILLQGVLATRELGSSWNAGPRDEDKRPKGVLVGRAARASANYRETYPAVAAVLVASALDGDPSSWGLFGGWLWLVMRLVYIP